jgi:tripartite-type tricarboxylate transporter receptor subunit TctC
MQAPQLFAVNADLPVKTVADLAEISRRDPAKLIFASYGRLLWLQTEILNRAIGVKATHVPMSSAPEAAQTVANGAAHYILGSMTPLKPFIDSGKIKVLAVTSNARDPNLPSAPSLKEAGIVMDDLTVWIALLAPKGTPKPIVDKLNGIVRDFTRDAEAATKMRAMGFEPTAASPEAFRAMFVKEQDAMVAIGKELGGQPE